MLDSDTANETGKTQEDVEANAFAGLLLMPDQLLSNQIDLFGIDSHLPSHAPPAKRFELPPQHLYCQDSDTDLSFPLSY